MVRRAGRTIDVFLVLSSRCGSISSAGRLCLVQPCADEPGWTAGVGTEMPDAARRDLTNAVIYYFDSLTFII